MEVHLKTRGECKERGKHHLIESAFRLSILFVLSTFGLLLKIVTGLFLIGIDLVKKSVREKPTRS